VRQSSMGEFSAIEPAHSWNSRPRLTRFFGGRKTGTLLADTFGLVHGGPRILEVIAMFSSRSQIGAALLIVAALGCAGCQQQKKSTSLDDVKKASDKVAKEKQQAQEAEQELAKTKGEFQQTQERDKYVQAQEQQLVQVDTSIEQLKEQAAKQQGAQQEDMKPRIDELDSQRKSVDKTLNSVRKAKPDEWKTMQADLDKGIQDLKQSVAAVQSGKAPAGQTGAAAGNQTASDQSKSGQQADQVKADQAKAEQAKAGQAKADQAKADQAQANQAKADQAKAQADQAKAQAEQAKSQAEQAKAQSGTTTK
jgi:septal ring factor EnvC (AmiA/AmiB activator)